MKNVDKMELSKCYRLILKSGEVYEFEFIGGEPLKGRLKDGSVIEVFTLINKVYTSLEEITCP